MMKQMSLFPDEEPPIPPAGDVKADSSPIPSRVAVGDVWRLGAHTLMCGDSTSEEDLCRLMGDDVADMVFTDPPYGMGKEGVIGDDLNPKKLLEFNREWIPLSFKHLKKNGSWYCWGRDEPLMDIYSEILKPMIARNDITFKNLLTWDKGDAGAGGVSFMGQKGLRSYPIGDEKCLFVTCGIESSCLNASDYNGEYESLRLYLLDQRKKCGWDIPMMKTVAGHSDKSRDHWTSKSQWCLPSREVYSKFRRWATEHDVDAFGREWDDLHEEYVELREGRKGMRAYFDNTHDKMTAVWSFGRVRGAERRLTGGHPTPKPIALCGRAIRSSTRVGECVLDLFGGSGSTMMACEEEGRVCRMMEMSPTYCDVIIHRWETLTGGRAERVSVLQDTVSNGAESSAKPHKTL